MFLHSDKELFRDVIMAASVDQKRPVAIIEKDIYKDDYREITTYFQNEPLEYDRAISVIKKLQNLAYFSLDKCNNFAYNIYCSLGHVRLAQLDRAFGYGPKGREFESSNART